MAQRNHAGWGKRLVLRLKGQTPSTAPGSTMRSIPHQEPVESSLLVSVEGEEQEGIELYRGAMHSGIPRLAPISSPDLLLYSELAGWCEGPGE